MKLELPSHRTVTLHVKDDIVPRTSGRPFTGARKLFTSGDVTIEDEKGSAVDVDNLALGDFHALRAIAVRLGWLHEKPIDIVCINCERTFEVSPCATFALGPFEERALHDPELDTPLPLGKPHPVPSQGDVVFSPVTLARARPLHAAITQRHLRITRHLVSAMGIASLSGERAPERIAARLRACSDQAFFEITRLFLMSHYSPRLFAMARCPGCGARNDVDAPYDREFDDGEDAADSRSSDVSNAKVPFVSFDAFAARAELLYEELVPEEARRELVFLVEGGTPACDDGGDPLLGSYLPPHPGDDANPSRQGEIAVFYRSFRAMWDEEDDGDAPVDWEGELAETIEHEFEHHIGFLRGHDPKDEEEHEEIEAEAVRIHGKRALARQDLARFGGDMLDFWRRTWFFWILALIAVALLTLSKN